MDRTSRIGIFVCLAVLAYLFFFAMPPAPKPRPATFRPVAPVTGAPNPATALTAVPAPPVATKTPEQIAFLENADVRMTLTSLGAAIKEVELKKASEGKDDHVVLNEQARNNVMQLSGWPGAESITFQGQQSPGSMVYTATLPGGAAWQRSYTLGKDFVLTVKDTITNPGGTALSLPAYGLSVGRAQPLRVAGHYQRASNMYLGSGWLTTNHFHLTTVNDFNPGVIPFIGIKTHDGKDAFASTAQDTAPMRWLGVENQFFTVLLTPTTDHRMDHAEFQCFNTAQRPGRGLQRCGAGHRSHRLLPGFSIPPGQSANFTYSLYAGPKDYSQLNALGENQGELMNYNGLLPFAYIIVPMLWTLHFYHRYVHNYGVAIILLTLTIKALTWKLQSVANRSGKRMQALAPKLKELQAKYKEQPEKLNAETFGLYKEYGVNPLGGCLPALIQMPVFFSLYYMLQNAGELRGQSFLWVHDLTQPDTVASILVGSWHLVLNPLPLMVTGLTMVMMRMTPQMGDPQQQKIAQFMPVFFLLFLYNFAAALSLYYVINNCVSILQIYRNLRKPLPELKKVPKKKGPDRPVSA